MNSVQISAQDIQQFANQLSNQEQEMTSVFRSIQTKMNEVQNQWQSPASSALMNEFQSMHAVFQSYTQAIQNYVQYLTTTSQTYEENECILQKSIQS